MRLNHAGATPALGARRSAQPPQRGSDTALPLRWRWRQGASEARRLPVFGGTRHVAAATRTAHAGPWIGLIGQVLLLAALALSVGLSGVGWVVGVSCAVITNAALAHGLSRYRSDGLGAADWVTLARASLAVCIAALVA